MALVGRGRLGKLSFGHLQACLAVLQRGTQVHDFPPQLLALFAEQASLLGTHGQLSLGCLGLAMELAAETVPVTKPVSQHDSLAASSGGQLEQRVQARVFLFCGRGRVAHAATRRSQLHELLAPAIPIIDLEVGLQVRLHLLVFLRPAGLAFQVAQTRRQLADDVLGARQIGLRFAKLVLGLIALGLVNGDACCLFKQLAPLLRALRQRLVDEALADDGIGALAQPRASQQLADVTQAHAVAVEVILVLARAVGAAADLNLVEVDRQPARRIVEGQHDVRHAEPGALFAAGEDHVFGAFAAQRAEALFAEHPAQRVGYI